MQPSKRTRMSIRKQNRAPRYTEEEGSDFLVDQVRQSVEDGKDDAVKRGPLEHRSVEASTIEGVDLQQAITMPPIGDLQLNRNPVELEDSKCTDSLIDTVVRKNTSGRPVPSADHPPLQPTISVKKDKGVSTRSPRTPNTSGRHVASPSSDHRSPATKQPRRSVKKVYKGAMTRDRAFEADLKRALAESEKEYIRAQMQRSIHGSTSRGIPVEGTSSHAAALEDDVAEPAKGDSDDEIDPAAVELLKYFGNNNGPKENSKDKKDDNDDGLGGSKGVRMRCLLSVTQEL